MQTARALAGSVVYKNQIYVIGGNSSISTKWRKELLPEHCVSSVEIFDPDEGSWSTGPELPNALCGAGQSGLQRRQCRQHVIAMGCSAFLSVAQKYKW